HERIVTDVLRIGLVAHDGERHGVRGTIMSPREPIERRNVAVARTCDEQGVALPIAGSVRSWFVAGRHACTKLDRPGGQNVIGRLYLSAAIAATTTPPAPATSDCISTLDCRVSASTAPRAIATWRSATA